MPFPNTSPDISRVAQDRRHRLNVACLGIRLIEVGRAKPVEQCAKAIRTIVQEYCATGSAESQWIAHLLVNLEWIAQAAMIFGDDELAAKVRAKMDRPNNLSEGNWSAALDMRVRLIEDFDEGLNRPGGSNYFPEDPRAELLRAMQRKG